MMREETALRDTGSNAVGWKACRVLLSTGERSVYVFMLFSGKLIHK